MSLRFFVIIIKYKKLGFYLSGDDDLRQFFVKSVDELKYPEEAQYKYDDIKACCLVSNFPGYLFLVL